VESAHDPITYVNKEIETDMYQSMTAGFRQSQHVKTCPNLT